MASGAESLDIRLGPTCEVRFTPRPGALDDLFPALLEDRTGEGPVADLLVGMTSIAERTARLRLEHGGRTLELSEGGHRLLPGRDSDCLLQVVRRDVKGGRLGGWLAALTGFAAEREALESRLPCEVPAVRVNSHPFEPRPPWGGPPSADEESPHRAVRRLLDEGEGCFPVPLGLPPLWDGTPRSLLRAGCLEEWLPFRPGAPLRECRRLLLLQRSGGAGTILPLRHGVLLDPWSVDLGVPGALAVIDAHALPLDLGGFRLRDDPALLAELRAQFAALAERLSQL